MCRFLLVSLSIDAILGEVTIRQRRKKLEEMKRGNGLSDAYTATLRRLKMQKGNKSILGLKVLMWVLYSERPLRAEELCHALGVETGSTDLDPENVPALRTLLASCLGLVRIEAASSTVRLVHFTLQEYLSNDPMLFHSPHSTITEVCLTYLNFGCVRDLSPTLSFAPSTMPLLEYASHYWGEHARRGMTENAKILALRLLNRFDEHISAQLLLLHYNRTRGPGPYFHSARGPTGFTGLHAVAFLGIMEIVAPVLEMKEWDVNAVDCMGSTALIWATRGGQDKVVSVLLEREDIDPNTAGIQDGRTPLTLAAESGHEGLVKMLLERQDTNPSTTDTKYGRAPLLWAAGRGHKNVVKMLLERGDVNPNQVVTQCGQALLSLAAECRDEGIVKMLLVRRDTDPNMADPIYGRTPLSWAARRGDEELVKMLLKREDVDPNQADTQCGRTPLSFAADYGHEKVVKMLLGREDTNPNLSDTKYGRTPLSLAAQHGHQGIVTMLSEREDVNLNTADTKYGRTPLSLAAEYGHERVVRILLERENINPNTADSKYGRTPLSWAAECGHNGVVKVLLERKDLRAATLDNGNQTPLLLALSKGHGGIAKILLERDNACYGRGDRSGQAPLPPSAGDGGGRVVKIGFRDDDPNTDIAKLNRQPSAKELAVEKSLAEKPKNNPIPKGGLVSERLKDVIINHRKGLQKMYGGTESQLDESLKVPIKRGEEMMRKLIMEMGFSREIATDLTVLTLYDMAILIGMLWC